MFHSTKIPQRYLICVAAETTHKLTRYHPTKTYRLFTARLVHTSQTHTIESDKTKKK